MSGANVSDLGTVDGAVSLIRFAAYHQFFWVWLSKKWMCAENELENHFFRSRLHRFATRLYFTPFFFLLKRAKHKNKSGQSKQALSSRIQIETKERLKWSLKCRETLPKNKMFSFNSLTSFCIKRHANALCFECAPELEPMYLLLFEMKLDGIQTLNDLNFGEIKSILCRDLFTMQNQLYIYIIRHCIASIECRKRTRAIVNSLHTTLWSMPSKFNGEKNI